MTGPDRGVDAGGANGERPVSHRGDAPAVYGSLLVTALIAVQWHYEASADFVAFSVLLSVAVFWLTHVWTEVVNRRVRGPVGRAEVAAIARAEVPMLTTALVPALLLGLARFEEVSVDTALALALAASVVQLFMWGLATGRALQRGWATALGVAVVDCALGLVIVTLKVIVVH